MNEMNAMPGKPFPEKLRLSLVHLAEAVRLVRELSTDPTMGTLPLYAVREYRYEMEDLLVDLLVTAVPSLAQAEEILSETGVAYLSRKMREVAEGLEDLK